MAASGVDHAEPQSSAEEAGHLENTLRPLREIHRHWLWTIARGGGVLGRQFV